MIPKRVLSAARTKEVLKRGDISVKSRQKIDFWKVGKEQKVKAEGTREQLWKVLGACGVSSHP